MYRLTCFLCIYLKHYDWITQHPQQYWVHCLLYWSLPHRLPLCRNITYYDKVWTRKVAISAALPLEVAHVASRSKCKLWGPLGRHTNAPSYQISAKLGTVWLRYLWFNKFSQPIFRGRGRASPGWISDCIAQTVSNLGRTHAGLSSTLNQFVLDFRHSSLNDGASNRSQISYFLTPVIVGAMSELSEWTYDPTSDRVLARVRSASLEFNGPVKEKAQQQNRSSSTRVGRPNKCVEFYVQLYT